MKHPTRHMRTSLYKVKRGRRAVGRHVSRISTKIQEDPSVRKVLAELAKHLLELAIRVVVFSVVNRCVRANVSTPERARVIPFNRSF
jgi:hypothetical protein